MNNIHQPDSYYDSMRSPRGDGQPSQTIQRQSSRHFENFGPPPDDMYALDGMRYDAPRYDRMNPLQSPPNYATFDMGMPQAWNSTSFNHNNNLAGINATTRGKPGTTRGRPGLPSMWMDQGPGMAPNGFGPAYGNPALGPPAFRGDHGSPESEEDLIPTAIVIKNIPFAVKKEQLVAVMTELNLPLPYAFNYHFDNGVFRGLAFANFTTADETAQVINAMNHLELHGRKLRVEYKKMLPQAERDRIEREKRERRGQLEEQHRPMPISQLQPRPSVGSLASGLRAVSPTLAGVPQGIDMNDKDTLNYYTKLMLFQADTAQERLVFPTHIPRQHRTIVHGLAHSLGLGHEAQGEEPQRQVIVFKISAGMSPSVAQSGFDSRRGLYRSATTDFNDVRESGPFQQTIQKQQSTNFLGFPEAHSALSASNNLRAAKSFADLRSFTPSPSHGNAGFPANLAANAAAVRYAEMGQSSPGSTRPPAMTPNTTAPAPSSDAIVNGMNSMTLNSGFATTGRQNSPSRLRSMMSWERDPAPGPIGGHRGLVGAGDDQSRSRASNSSQPRQGRNSVIERGTGFSRGRPNGHGSRGSDELLPHNGIDTVVE